MSGELRLENTGAFFADLNKWVDAFAIDIKANPLAGRLSIDFKLEYFNSIAAKYLYALLHKFPVIHTNRADISIRWYYDAPDQDMKEAGEEFANLITVPFEIIAIDWSLKNE